MKRDLKKWLTSDAAFELAKVSRTFDEVDGYNICQEIIEEANYGSVEDMERVVQAIWCAAQKQFLKDIIDDIDDLIDKTFDGNEQVVNAKARHVVEESNLKAWLYGKYKYLQSRNGK